MYIDIMSQESETSGPRPYRKRARARQEAETRRRITEAVIELHRTVGPARTTVTEVAERAGVSRVTVYNHFPTEGALVEACSALWSERNPPPNPANWSAIEDAPDRALAALRQLYAWYRETEDMLSRVLRDAPLVAPLDELVNADWQPFMDQVVTQLARGWQAAEEPAPERVTVLRLVADFQGWQLLTRSGLDDVEAAALAVRLVEAAG